MFWTLLLQWLSLCGNDHNVCARGPHMVWATQDALAAEGSFFKNDPDGIDAARLIMQIIYFESRGRTDAKTPEGDSGVMQVRSASSYGSSQKAVLESATVGIQVGIRILKESKKCCGGPAIRWLGAYASGKCGGVPQIMRLRCGPLELCDKP